MALYDPNSNKKSWEQPININGLYGSFNDPLAPSNTQNSLLPPSTLGGQSSLGGAGYKAYMLPGVLNDTSNSQMYQTWNQQKAQAPETTQQEDEGAEWRKRMYQNAPSAKIAAQGQPVANAAADQAAREQGFKDRGLDAEGKNKFGLYAGGKTFGENLEGMDASQAMSLMQAGGTMAGLIGNFFR